MVQVVEPVDQLLGVLYLNRVFEVCEGGLDLMLLRCGELVLLLNRVIQLLFPLDNGLILNDCWK